MSDSKPWEVHKELQEDRLIFLAGMIKRVRHEAVLVHEPSKGDTNWGLGCRVHERTCHAIKEAVADQTWLDVIDPSLHFVFSIGVVPIRFYRGEAESPNPRHLSRRYPEIEAQQLAFEFRHEDGEWLWRMAIETDFDGEVMRIVMVQVAENGDIKNLWTIPLTGNVPIITPIHERQRNRVDLAPPIIAPRRADITVTSSGKE
jgi:hypothetical protein